MGLKAEDFIRLTVPDPPILTRLWLPYFLLSSKTDNYRFNRKYVGERIFHGHIRTQRPRKVLNRPLKHQCQLLVAKNRLFLKTGNFRSLPVIGQGRYPQYATIRRTLLFGSYEKNLSVQAHEFCQIRRFDQFSRINIWERPERLLWGFFSLVKPEIFRKKIRILPNLLKCYFSILTPLAKFVKST